VGPGGALIWLAPAKLNLSLKVLGARGDGFHELDSVAAKVTLYDELAFRPRDDGRIDLACSEFDCGPVEENLVFRAAEALRERAGAKAGADIRLVKRIPPGSGLGGGSSDAAAALKALTGLWGLSLSPAELAELAAALGSDVPLFLDGPAVRMRGRGQHCQPLRVRPFWALLVLPDLHCSAGEAYAAYDALAAEGRPSRAGGPAVWESLVSAGQIDLPPSKWRDQLVNDLAPAAMRLRPELAEMRRRLALSVGEPVHVTGSGSGLFVLLDDEAGAGRALDAVPDGMRGRCRIVTLNSW